MRACGGVRLADSRVPEQAWRQKQRAMQVGLAAADLVKARARAAGKEWQL